jgi:hypothetical protein
MNPLEVAMIGLVGVTGIITIASLLTKKAFAHVENQNHNLSSNSSLVGSYSGGFGVMGADGCNSDGGGDC